MDFGQPTISTSDYSEEAPPSVERVPGHTEEEQNRSSRADKVPDQSILDAETQPPKTPNRTQRQRVQPARAISFTSSNAASALENFSRAQESHRAALETYNVTRDANSDDEEDTDCPIVRSFTSEGGKDGMHSTTNFSIRGFLAVWDTIAEHVHKNWNTGRGRRTSHTGKDVLFMTMAVLKHGGQWDWLARIFGMSGPTFQRLIVSFVRATRATFERCFISEWSEKLTLYRLSQRNELFQNVPIARYATDVIFQTCNRPTGNLAESKPYFSGKHKAYGYKVEASVLPNGICIGVSPHYVGSVTDIDIMRRNEAFHQEQTKKVGTETTMADTGNLRSTYPENWAILADKGYQGADQLLRVIVPIKKPPGGSLSAADLDSNFKFSSDRIVVENYFGRLCGLWQLFSTRWRWSEDLYDDMFVVAIALTNCHIRHSPLRADDGRRYNQVRNMLATIATEKAEKRRQTQQRYRDNRRRRLDIDWKQLTVHLQEKEDIQK